MEVTVRIDDSTPTGKRLIKELHRYRKVVKFDNPAVTGIVPEGYVTGDEFERIVIEKLTNSFKEHGLL